MCRHDVDWDAAKEGRLDGLRESGHRKASACSKSWQMKKHANKSTPPAAGRHGLEGIIAL